MYSSLDGQHRGSAPEWMGPEDSAETVGGSTLGLNEHKALLIQNRHRMCQTCQKESM